MRNVLLGLSAAVLLFSSGCGTLFFSHRIGKKPSVKVDEKVFYTDCFLCLFGIIPGVVAFILDYDNGTIYYSEAELIPDEDLYGQFKVGDMKKVACSRMEVREIASSLSKLTGKPVSAAEVQLALCRAGSCEMISKRDLKKSLNTL